jgi:hypothetical protein
VRLASLPSEVVITPWLALLDSRHSVLTASRLMPIDVVVDSPELRHHLAGPKGSMITANSSIIGAIAAEANDE